MCMIDGRMDAELHTSILQVEFLAIVEFCGLDRHQLTFQQDNDPKDTFEKASKWFQWIKDIVLKWPVVTQPQPIQIWVATPHVAEQCLWVPPAGVDELWEQVLVKWDSTPSKVCRNVIVSKPRRIGVVIKAKKAQTKYQQKN